MLSGLIVKNHIKSCEIEKITLSYISNKKVTSGVLGFDPHVNLKLTNFEAQLKFNVMKKILIFIAVLMTFSCSKIDDLPPSFEQHSLVVSNIAREAELELFGKFVAVKDLHFIINAKSAKEIGISDGSFKEFSDQIAENNKVIGQCINNSDYFVYEYEGGIFVTEASEIQSRGSTAADLAICGLCEGMNGVLFTPFGKEWWVCRCKLIQIVELGAIPVGIILILNPVPNIVGCCLYAAGTSVCIELVVEGLYPKGIVFHFGRNESYAQY